MPKPLRDSYDLREGDSLTLLDLGGVFVLTLRHLETDRLADRIRERLIEEGVSNSDLPSKPPPRYLPRRTRDLPATSLVSDRLAHRTVWSRENATPKRYSREFDGHLRL